MWVGSCFLNCLLIKWLISSLIPYRSEYDVIPITEQSINKSPVIVIEDKLGIESWCIKHLYGYANKMFLQLKHNPQTKDIERLIEVTRVLIMLNPEYASAWNVRKDMIQRNMLDPMQELVFSQLILKNKPKSSDAFTHRRFLISFIMSNRETNGETSLDNLIDNELRLCTETADKYPRNYYSWSHRLWILENLCKEDQEFMRREMDFLTTWIPSHVSEYSAFNYRQLVLSKLLPKVIQDQINVFISEYDWLNHMFSFIGRESLFLYRRFLFRSIHSSLEDPSITNRKEQLKNLEEQERDFLFTQFDRSKQYKSSWHLHLTKQYDKWINSFLQHDSWSAKNSSWRFWNWILNLYCNSYFVCIWE